MKLVCYKGDSIIDALIRIIREDKYTHVGIALEEPMDGYIKYYACREDYGVGEYNEPIDDVDLYDIPKYSDEKYVKNFIEKTPKFNGSMISDMGYDELKEWMHMGSVEWVARALDLGLPEKYTIDKLIEFCKTSDI